MRGLGRGLGQALSTAVRAFSSSTGEQSRLLRLLLCNAELDEASARDELRWMADASGAVDWRGGPLNELVRQRARGMPLQYVLGDTDFGPLRLLCRPPTLIPRPETAQIFSRLAEEVRKDGRTGMSILDLCTGSAPIPLLLAHELGERVKRVYGVDASEAALQLARENVELLAKIEPSIPEKVDLWRADVFASSFVEATIERIGGRVDILTVNPPYISSAEYAALPPSVRAHEDRAALEAEAEGLAFYTRIAEIAPQLIKPSGGKQGEIKLAVEIGHEQSRAVRGIFERGTDGLVKRTACWMDQYGRDRMVVGYG